MNKEEQLLARASQKEAEAYAWVVRLSSDQRTRQDEAGFEKWLQEDRLNANRYGEGLALWKQLGALGDSDEARETLGHLYERGPPQVAERRRVSRRAVLGSGVGALAATVAGVLVLPRLHLSDHVTYETAKGEQRRIALDDGSVIMLDTATKVQVAMSASQRVIALLKGQAFFDVAHDPARPFRVFAGADEIRAIGTAFQVRYESGATRVVLEEGKVAVFRGGAFKPVPKANPNLQSGNADVVLHPGQATNLTSTEPPKVEAVDLSRTDAWRDGELVFDDVPLSIAVAEVNRYGGRTVILADESTGRLHVSGTFHTNRPEDFVEGVTAALPVRVEESDDSKLVLKAI